MKAVLIGLPVIKDARRFHLDKGRRWTVIEHILLEALAKQDWIIEDLAKAAALPRRIVIEVVIRLMRAGWVELRMSGGRVLFSSTATGRLYAGRDELPPVTRPSTRYAGYVVELVTGVVFKARDLVTLTTDQWAIRSAGRPATEVTPRLDQTMAAPDIRVLEDRLLDSDEQVVRVDAQDWRPRRMVGLVTVRGDDIEGLPADIPDILRTEILDAAHRTMAGAEPVQAPVPSSVGPIARALRPSVAITFRSDDLILGGAAHRQSLERALARAEHRVVLHSTFISEPHALAVLKMLEQPVRRGAVVDILWGQSREKDNVNKTRQAALALNHTLVESGLQDRIRVHMTTTRSHAKLLLADTGERHRVHAVVGSCNWLSSDFGAFDASVRLREPKLVAQVAEDLAELARPRDGQMPDVSIELLRLAREVERSGVLVSGRGLARIVTAPEHAGLVADARELARSRIVVASHRLDAAAKPALAALSAAGGPGHPVGVTACYGRPGERVSDASVQDLRHWAGTKGMRLEASRAKLHAKVLAWDADSLLITSQNLLSADPGDSDPRQELGVFIQAQDAAQLFMNAFDELQGPSLSDGHKHNV